MKIFRQLLLFCIVLAAGLFIWIKYVPAAQPLLAKTGILDLFGIEMAAPAAGGGSGPRRGGSAAQVITQVVGERALADRVSAIGDGRARRAVTVRSNAGGVITQLNLSAGSYVEAGTTIVRLQDENERIALDQAKIQLEDAASEVERVRKLESSGTTSAVRLREVQLVLRSAELAVRQAEFDLSQRQIAAPISGWVGILDLEEGDRVNAQDVLVGITDRSYILIDFRVPERVVNKIKVGQTFDVSPIGFGDTPLVGNIRAIDSIIDRASRTLLVQGQVENDADLLRAGMAFSVKLTFPGQTVLSIPPLALQWSSDGPFVWAVRDGIATPVSVVLEQRNSDEVLITSPDLAAGDTVVTEGVQTLRPGAEVVSAQARETAAAARATPAVAEQ